MSSRWACWMYELIAGHFPYEYQNLMDGQIEKLIVSRKRPSLQKREVTNPLYYLSCMCWCWQDDPRSRPTASKLVEVRISLPPPLLRTSMSVITG